MDVPKPISEPDLMLMFEVAANMLNILRRDGAERWLQTPLRKLDGRTPLAAFMDGDGSLVLEVTRNYFDPSFG